MRWLLALSLVLVMGCGNYPNEGPVVTVEAVNFIPGEQYPYKLYTKDESGTVDKRSMARRPNVKPGDKIRYCWNSEGTDCLLRKVK